MKIKEIYKGLYLFTFPNQFELTSHFFRLQEFYESPIKQVKGKYFSYEDAITYYAYHDKDEPQFTYFEDWAGFNVPGHIVDKFVSIFQDTITDKELTLLDSIPDDYKKYYVIGVEEGEEDTMKHEIAHGLYYLNRKYRKEMNELYDKLPNSIKESVKKELLRIGYCKQVVKDETQAYLSTGIREGMISLLNRILYINKIRKFKKIFKKYYKELINENINQG